MDVERILRRATKSFGGGDYLDRMEEELERLPESCKELVIRAIVNIRSELSEKYYWQE